MTTTSDANAHGSETRVEPLIEPARQKPPTERFHQLDGLRAVAVGIVLFHHAFTGPIANRLRAAAVPALEYAGNLLHAVTGSGVELFFVLSGVLLLRPYVRGLRPFKPATYFLRRAERLWPPYLVVLLLAGVVRWVAWRWPTWLSVEGSISFNLPDWLKQLPIVNFGTPFWNMAWWSLSIEVLFYLTVPLVLPLFAWKHMNRAMLAAVAVVVWVVGIAALTKLDEANPLWFDSLQKLAVYSLCFLVGIAIAKFDWSPLTGWALLGLGVLYLLLAVAIPAMNFHSGFALLYGGIVILAFVPGGRLAQVLSSPLMIWTGERSYSIFLIHLTAFFAVNYAVSWVVAGKDMRYLAVTRGLGIPLAILGAMILFQTVERRFARNLVTADKFWPPMPGVTPSRRSV